MAGVEEFNALPADEARAALVRCCSADGWVTAVAAGRPYQSIADVLARSDAAVAALTQAQLAEALAGHPRIGDRLAAGWSGQEQSGVAAADPGLRSELADGNARYEQHFGHIYLACATGRTAAELLAFLRERLGNDREAEWVVVRSELAAINRLRLRRLVGGEP